MYNTLNHKILIIDDEVAIIEELSEYIASIGFEVFSTVSAVDVCDILINDPAINIIITDLKMPRLNGFSLIEQIKSIVPASHDLSFIIVSGNYDVEDALKAVRLGVSDFLTKPLSTDLLHHALKRISETLYLRKQEKKFIIELEASTNAAKVANKEIILQNKEKEKRAVELALVNKKLASQNEEKEKQAYELALANKELANQKELEVYRSEMERVAKDLTMLIDTANAPIFGIDAHGKVNEWNQKSAEITGFHASEVLGKDLVKEFITTNYHHSVSEVLQNALRGDETSNFEFPLYTKNNKLVMVLLNATTRRDALGNVVGVVGVGQDITELDSYRSEMEVKVNKRTHELNTMLELSPDGLVLVSDDNCIRYINPAFLDMTGFKPDKLLGKPIEIFVESMASLFDPGKMEDVRCIGGEDGEQIVYLLRPVVRILHCNIRTMNGLTGAKEGQVLYFRDVTHETEVDRMKSDFLSTAAHELRTPLASIYGFSELLMSRDYDKKTSYDIYETIHRQSLNLKHLLDELLDLSRIEARAGKDFYMEYNTLQEIVEESCIEVEGAFSGRKVNLQIQKNWPLLSFDIEKMRQVFRNLLSNGFKYSAENEDVILQTSVREKHGNKQFGVSIIDSGIGMTPEQLEHVGERFYRADQSGSVPGSGLGVSLVKEITSIHGGDVEFVSVIGQGTAATVWLPIIESNLKS
jgi:PAS domain S-box-containing protein